MLCTGTRFRPDHWTCACVCPEAIFFIAFLNVFCLSFELAVLNDWKRGWWEQDFLELLFFRCIHVQKWLEPAFLTSDEHPINCRQYHVSWLLVAPIIQVNTFDVWDRFCLPPKPMHWPSSYIIALRYVTPLAIWCLRGLMDKASAS